LICFFLPWVQVSCGATKETASGVDLARDGSGGLWLIPLLMLAILVYALRLWKARHELSALLTLISGLVSAYLMNHERLKFEDRDGFLQVSMTGWFWLGLGSAVALVIVGVVGVWNLRKSRTEVGT
jgi:uncharacterized membrane protein YiaA